MSIAPFINFLGIFLTKNTLKFVKIPLLKIFLTKRHQNMAKSRKNTPKGGQSTSKKLPKALPKELSKSEKVAKFIVGKFQKATQKKKFTKAQVKLASRAFVSGMVTLAEASGDGLTTEEWDDVYSIVAVKLMDYEF